MTELAHSALFVAAVLALTGGALRLASLAARRGLERLLAAAVVACALAVLECLLLGLAGLGGDPLTLAAAAGITWAAARRWVPAPPGGSRRGEVLEFVAPSSAAVRGLLGALGGMLVGLAFFALRHPLVGLDGMDYHLPEILSWIHSGHPGAMVTSIPGLPTGSYPLTNEVLLAWGMALARSFTPVALWAATSTALLLAAGWLGLRRLALPRPVAALALAALVAAPAYVAELNTPMNDGVTLSWLVVTAALALAAVPDQPRLFAIAGLAGALAIGTKTTAAPLVALVLVLGAARMRAWSRPALLLAGIAGLGAGGTWYLRDLIQHGSPFWPLLQGPFGDPLPASLAQVDVRFIERPRATLEGRAFDYAAAVGGNVVLLAGGMIAVALARTRRIAAASAATLVSLLLWTAAPFTGRGTDPAIDLSLSVTRYLLPGAACGALALALATRRGRAGGRLALAALAAALVWSLYESARLPFPTAPGHRQLAVGALVGAALASAGNPLVRALRRAPVRLAALAATATATALSLAALAPGYVARTARIETTFGTPVLRWFSTQPAFRDGSDPIATTAPLIGLLAGDRLRHRLDLVAQHESCTTIRARARHGWVVVLDYPVILFKFFPPTAAQECLAGQRPLFAAGLYRVYRTPGP